jgi:hypothetical protein
MTTAASAAHVRRHTETLDRIDAGTLRQDEALARIDVHERICLERWERILERMSRMETVVLASAGTLITGMAGLLLTLLMRGH